MRPVVIERLGVRRLDGALPSFDGMNEQQGCVKPQHTK